MPLLDYFAIILIESALQYREGSSGLAAFFQCFASWFNSELLAIGDLHVSSLCWSRYLNWPYRIGLWRKIR